MSLLTITCDAKRKQYATKKRIKLWCDKYLGEEYKVIFGSKQGRSYYHELVDAANEDVIYFDSPTKLGFLNKLEAFEEGMMKAYRDSYKEIEELNSKILKLEEENRKLQLYKAALNGQSNTKRKI